MQKLCDQVMNRNAFLILHYLVLMNGINKDRTLIEVFIKSVSYFKNPFTMFNVLLKVH